MSFGFVEEPSENGRDPQLVNQLWVTSRCWMMCLLARTFIFIEFYDLYLKCLIYGKFKFPTDMELQYQLQWGDIGKKPVGRENKWKTLDYDCGNAW